MTAKIIDGKRIAAEVREELRGEVEALVARGCIPKLSVVLVGENPASQIYVRMKTRASEDLGISSDTILLPSETTQAELLEVVNRLNRDSDVHGILVQLPLPSQIEERVITHAVLPEKDVDGFHPMNRGKLATGEDTFLPCTPLGIQVLLERSGIDPGGQDVVVVGRSNIVGMPLATMLAHKKPRANATVTICHSGTKELAKHTASADILIAAMGRAEFIRGEMVKEGAVVVDVGVNRVDDPSVERGYRVVGDVHFASVAERASAITPVPGGVGPMTIAMLLYNTVKAAKSLCASSSTG